jgi:hypothetical protein
MLFGLNQANPVQPRSISATLADQSRRPDNSIVNQRR